MNFFEKSKSYLESIQSLDDLFINYRPDTPKSMLLKKYTSLLMDELSRVVKVLIEHGCINLEEFKQSNEFKEVDSTYNRIKNEELRGQKGIFLYTKFFKAARDLINYIAQTYNSKAIALGISDLINLSTLITEERWKGLSNLIIESGMNPGEKIEIDNESTENFTNLILFSSPIRNIFSTLYTFAYFVDKFNKYTEGLDIETKNRSDIDKFGERKSTDLEH